MTFETCQICGKTKNVDCKGHDNPSSSKQRLDAIRAVGPAQRAPVSPDLSLKEQLDAIPSPGSASETTGGGGGGGLGLRKQPDATSNILGRKTNSGTDDLKNQLNAIPTPGSGAGAPATAPAASGGFDPSALDSIPTPGSGVRAPAAAPSPAPAEASGGFDPSALDSIPTPGSGGRAPSPVPSPAPAAASAGFDPSALDAIPTPGAGGGVSASPSAPASPASPAGGGFDPSLLDSIPTPSAAARPGVDKPTGEVPQWQKNFEAHQASISTSKFGGQGDGGYEPAPMPQSYGASRGGDAPPPQGSTYNMIIALVVIICIAMFGYLMIAKPEPAKVPDESTTSGSAPSSPPSTPVQSVPITPQTSMPTGIPTGMPTNMPSATPTGMPVDNTAVPMQTPTTYPGATPTLPGTAPNIPQGNNPVPVQQGNNP